VHNGTATKEMHITGGIDENLQGFQDGLRGYIRRTIANPSVYGVHISVRQGYFVLCDSVDGDVWASSATASGTPDCADSLGEKWFYIPPTKTAVYGVGAHQYGQDVFGVLQDLATVGCDNQTLFAESIPGHIPNTDPNDPTSDYYNPSPCKILGMIASSSPYAKYWLPPGHGTTTTWQIKGNILSADVSMASQMVDAAYLIDVDIPTNTMPYLDTISPGYVDDSLSRCYTYKPDDATPTVVPGFLAPMVCNPAVENPSDGRPQTYTLHYTCDPSVILARTTDTLTMSNGQCKATSVPYNISIDKINGADRACTVTVDPGLDNPYDVQCFFGAVIQPSSSSCSVIEFTCNFHGTDGGAWYRCIWLWIILGVVLLGTALLIWYSVRKSEKDRVRNSRKGTLDKYKMGITTN
jgi:hypothetical protein